MQLRAVIFDLDNTLCDTTKALNPSFNTCFKFLVNYYPAVSKVEFNKLHQKVYNKLSRRQKIPLYSSQALFWHEMFDQLKLEYNPAVIKDLILLLNDELGKNVDLFPGIKPMLQEVKKMNLKTAILSNGPYIGKALRFEYLNLNEYIDILISSDLIRRDKPSPRAFHYVLRKLKVKPEEVVFLGDELVSDIKGASAVGMKTIYNKWNGQKLNGEDKSIKPDYVVTKPQQVVKILKQMI